MKRENLARRSAAYQIFEIVCLVAFFSMNAYALSAALAAGWNQPHFWWLAPLMIVLGWMAADFAVGIVHWLFDNYFDEKTPFFGPNIVAPFRSHHVDPEKITHHNIGEQLGNSAMLGLTPQFLLALYAEENPALVLGLNTGAFFGVIANMFHSWAHTDGLGGWRRWLQKLGVALDPRHHNIHHAPPNDIYYCVCSGVMNPILTWLRFFPIVEWVIAKTTGVAPLHRQTADQLAVTRGAAVQR